MRAPRTALVAVAAMSAMATALSGCATSGDGTSPSSNTSTTDVGTAGRQLTEAETKAALPDVPARAFNVNVNEDVEAASQRKTDPKQCLEVMFFGKTMKRLNRTDHVRSDLYWQTGNGPDLVGSYTSVTSYSSPVGSRVFAEAGKALGACGTFEYTGKDSNGPFSMQIEASIRPTRNFGQQTISTRFSTRIRVGGSPTPYYIDHLHFRVGHNLVTVRETHYDKDRGTDDLEDRAQAVIAHLRE